MAMSQQEKNDAVLKAVAHPLRRKIPAASREQRQWRAVS
jgi:hypothetical protein